MSNHTPILINIPNELLHRLNEAAGSLELSRSELIRRSLYRDLMFVVRHEVAELAKAKTRVAAQYASWTRQLKSQKADQSN